MLKNIATNMLDIAYDEQGDISGRPVVLLHGFPYDIHTYDEVTPRLAHPGAPVLLHRIFGAMDQRVSLLRHT
jgi:pimeloyl-ACP methyl ester carboxylesterase